MTLLSTAPQNVADHEQNALEGVLWSSGGFLEQYSTVNFSAVHTFWTYMCIIYSTTSSFIGGGGIISDQCGMMAMARMRLGDHCHSAVICVVSQFGKMFNMYKWKQNTFTKAKNVKSIYIYSLNYWNNLISVTVWSLMEPSKNLIKHCREGCVI